MNILQEACTIDNFLAQLLLQLRKIKKTRRETKQFLVGLFIKSQLRKSSNYAMNE